MNTNSFSQANLIYNGDFELIDSCPTNNSTPSDYQIERCKGWKSPTYATSDYFNSCANSLPGNIGVPYNFLGYQNAYSGNAYCGILNEFTGPLWGNYGFWIEYLQGNLTSPLKPNYEYEFSCHIVFTENYYDYSYSKFGIALTPTAISRSDGKPFSEITPKIINPNNNFLTDTSSWTEIKGRFYAQGGEQYITLGFFVDTTNLDTLNVSGLPSHPDGFVAYYLIDACDLSETGNILQYPNVFTPNGDGINDVFFINGLEKGDIVKIFNRWGIPLAQLNEPKSAWDGYTSTGQKCSSGVYYYVIEKSNGDIFRNFLHLQY